MTASRAGPTAWPKISGPGFDEEVIFEPGLENFLLMLTLADGAFPAGPTICKAGSTCNVGGGDRSARVT